MSYLVHQLWKSIKSATAITQVHVLQNRFEDKCYHSGKNQAGFDKVNTINKGSVHSEDQVQWTFASRHLERLIAITTPYSRLLGRSSFFQFTNVLGSLRKKSLTYNGLPYHLLFLRLCSGRHVDKVILGLHKYLYGFWAYFSCCNDIAPTLRYYQWHFFCFMCFLY